MALDLTQEQIDSLWGQGYRPYEIYTYNTRPVGYMGSLRSAGTVSGWDIEHVFAKRDSLLHYPFYDTLIGTSTVADCTCVYPT